MQRSRKDKVIGHLQKCYSPYRTLVPLVVVVNSNLNFGLSVH